MSRPLRIEFPGALYHLTARGNARQNIFLDDDRQRFIDLLGREIEQQRWKCYAYCLMDNHYHLLLETPEANLVQGMRRLNSVYTQSFNRSHGRIGQVLQGRYKSIVVERESYLLELCRYVVLNPIRAKKVKRIGDWPWSSYRATVGKAKAPTWLEIGWVLKQFGTKDKTPKLPIGDLLPREAEAPLPGTAFAGRCGLGRTDF
ncbi:MAG: transposase [Nitrospiria bacterium]